MLWILLVVISVLGVTAGVGVMMRNQKKLPAKSDPKLLGAGGMFVERTVRDLRVDDVLTMDGKDFLCEGLISYDEDGHKWVSGRVVDEGVVHWLLMGIERAASSSTRMLQQDDSTPITGYPPEAIVIGEIRYVLDKRGAATCQLFGDVGPLGALKKDRPAGHVERCRWWLYGAPGEDTLLVEQWGSDYRVLRGKKIVDGTVELIPGS
ncbi:MAG: DUF4178 domain-containing protein [Deltaproteobacteria bacterium]|nr:DUF4178 domain-containing protein [Deltaproteobacteria bacterium]